MADPRHSAQTKNHRLEAFVFADATARAAGTGYTIVAEDVGKIAYQTDDGSYWRLVDDSPLTWSQKTGTGSADATGAAGGDLTGTYPNPTIKTSVALGGNPTTTTQSVGNDSTRIATTAYVMAAINALINSAPGALDTLKELADAINDDASFAATVTTALAGKQPLDSDLTAIAALTTTTFGRALLALADAAALQTAASLVPGTDVQAYSATLAALASVMSATATAAAQRTALGLGASALLGDDTRSVSFAFDGGGNVVTSGSKAELIVEYACEVLSATIIADQAGSAVIDIKKADYATFPTLASIAAANKPTLAAVQKNQDSSLTGWTTTLAAGDILQANVDSVSTCKRIVVVLKVRRTA